MVKGYAISIRTRSAAKDYRWIGPQPREWWTEPQWGSSHLRMAPTLLINTHQGTNSVLISGIQCERRDGTSQTRIRYDLAFWADSSVPRVVATEGVVSLVSAWWHQRLTGSDRSWPLGDALDVVLDPTAQEPWEGVDRAVDSHDLTSDQWARLQALAASSQKAVLEDVPILHNVWEMQSGWIGSEHPSLLAILNHSIAGIEPAPSIAYSGILHADDMLSEKAQTKIARSLPEAALLIVDGSGDDLRPKVQDGAAQELGPPSYVAPRRERIPSGLTLGVGALILFVILVTVWILVANR